MLRNDDEQVVTLDTELKFVLSYTYLLKVRYGDGLEVLLYVEEAERKKNLPPLSLQTIMENAITQNTLNKKNPLQIIIAAKGDGMLEVINTRQPKQLTESMDTEAELDNLVNKYALLNEKPVTIRDTPKHRIIQLPLITKNVGVTV